MRKTETERQNEKEKEREQKRKGERERERDKRENGNERMRLRKSERENEREEIKMQEQSKETERDRVGAHTLDTKKNLRLSRNCMILMMIAFITISRLIPLIKGLCSWDSISIRVLGFNFTGASFNFETNLY